jgi:hypothetical protein
MKADNPPTDILAHKTPGALTSAVSAIAARQIQTPPQIWVSEIA